MTETKILNKQRKCERHVEKGMDWRAGRWTAVRLAQWYMLRPLTKVGRVRFPTSAHGMLCGHQLGQIGRE